MFVACGHISQRQSKRLFKMSSVVEISDFLLMCWRLWDFSSCLLIFFKLPEVEAPRRPKKSFLWFSMKCLTCSDNRTTWYNYRLFNRHLCSYNMWLSAVQHLLILITISVCTVIAVSSEFLLWGVAHRNWTVSASTGSDVLSARALLQTPDQLMAPICCLPAINKLREEEEARLVALRQQS